MPALHTAVRSYLAQIEALKKPGTYRRYEAVLECCVEFSRDRQSLTRPLYNTSVHSGEAAKAAWISPTCE